jgi:hypothetical protein
MRHFTNISHQNEMVSSHARQKQQRRPLKAALSLGHISKRILFSVDDAQPSQPSRSKPPRLGQELHQH